MRLQSQSRQLQLARTFPSLDSFSSLLVCLISKHKQQPFAYSFHHKMILEWKSCHLTDKQKQQEQQTNFVKHSNFWN